MDLFNYYTFAFLGNVRETTINQHRHTSLVIYVNVDPCFIVMKCKRTKKKQTICIRSNERYQALMQPSEIVSIQDKKFHFIKYIYQDVSRTTLGTLMVMQITGYIDYALGDNLFVTEK